MNKGQKYDQMTQKPKDDPLGLFENYHENMVYLQEYIRTQNSKEIYDMGCGTGNLTGPLACEFKVIGIDQSDEMLNQAALKYPQMVLIHGSLEDWMENIDTKTDALFISSFVLHGIKVKDSLMAFFSDVLDKNNTVVIVDYFFLNKRQEILLIQELETSDQYDLANFIKSKHYLMMDTLEEWCEMRDYDFKVKMFNHWIGMVEIKNLKASCRKD